MTNRQSVLKQINENRKAQLSETAIRYAKLPENIRAAIAEGAGVPNKGLDQVNSAERNRLKLSAKSLANKVTAAWGLLVQSDFME